MDSKNRFDTLRLAANQSVKERDYWLARLAGDLEKTAFPYDFDYHLKEASGPISSECVKTRLSQELYTRLMALSKDSPHALFMILAANLAILLHKYTGHRDIIIGSPIYQQEAEEDFVNTILALRSWFEDDITFKEFLLQVKETIDEAEQNQNYPIEILCEQLGVPLPPFDAAVLLESIHDREYLSRVRANVIFSFSCTKKQVAFQVEYNPRLYESVTIERIMDHFKNLLEKTTVGVEARVADLDILSNQEKERLLYGFNDKTADYPRDRCIHELFEQQLQTYPDNVALVGMHENSQLTYRPLNQRADRLSQSLRSKGVGSDTIVSLMMEKSPGMILAILGILKAGAAYLPIDPEYPQERIEYMLSDSGAEILVTSVGAGLAPARDMDIIPIPEIFFKGGQPQGLPLQNLHLPPAPGTCLAYIVFTSGTTGRPKGVAVGHENLVAYVKAFEQEFALQAADTVLQQASFCFDAFAEEVYPILLKGGKLAVPSRETVRDVRRLQALILKHGITLLSCSPLLLNELNKYDAPGSVHTFISGGDVLKREYIEKLLTIGKVYNTYGPSETTVCVTYFRCEREDRAMVPIGSPIANYRVFILDSAGYLLPQGAAGELCVSGPGLARGYLNRPELTAEKFITAPAFSPQPQPDMPPGTRAPTIPSVQHSIIPAAERSEARLYRSGDLCRWLDDGNIQFLGRIDSQVKIRGYRIELAEIENRLLNHEEIEDAVVIDRADDNGDRYLCAYFVSKAIRQKEDSKAIREEGTEAEGVGAQDFVPLQDGISIGDLREFLSHSLPDFMIPSFFVPLEKIPLTPNGKIDRKALPAPKIDRTDRQYVAPRNEIEEKLARIWSDVLFGRAAGPESLPGIDDSFFELGGHSLNATTLVYRVYKAFEVDIEIGEIFAHPTIRQLSQRLQEREKVGYREIPLVEKKEYYILSSAQKRLYILNQFDPGSTAYNMTAVLELIGAVNRERLTDTFNYLIRRHESLRTSLFLNEGEPVQKIHEHVHVDFEYYEHRAPGTMPHAGIIGNFIRPFDLSLAPLLRVGLIKIPAERHILVLDMHHIVSDGISLEILAAEFMAIYGKEELPPLRIQYKEYAGWQNSAAARARIKDHETYWLDRFIGEIPVLDLPTDHDRPVVQGFAGRTARFAIDEEWTSALKRVARDRGATLFMALLALYNILLAKLSGQEDIVVGTPIAGRRHADLEPIIGMFVNTLALRNYPAGEKTFSGFLEEVKSKTLEAYDNQDYLFEELVENVGVKRDPGRNPLFDVMFALQNIESTEIEIPGLKLAPYDYENRTVKFDMNWNADERDEGLLFSLQYNTTLFEAGTVERMIAYFSNIWLSVTEEPGKEISRIEVLSAQEKKQLLLDFNLDHQETLVPAEKTLPQLFADQAEAKPDRIAVVCSTGNRLVTYRQLHKMSNRLSGVLRTRGAAEGAIAAILSGPSLEMIAAVLAVLQAGGAYLPIDAAFPKERIEYMVADSGAKILLTTRNVIDRFQGRDRFKTCPYIESIDECRGESVYSPDTRVGAQNVVPLQHRHLPLKRGTPGIPSFGGVPEGRGGSALAYVIYTSGTTGSSKGVLISQKNLLNYVGWFVHTARLTANDRALLTSSFAFDLGYTSIYPSLLSGCQLHLIPEDINLSAENMLHYIGNHLITYLKMTPSLFSTLVESSLFTSQICETLRLLVLGGEAIKPQDAARARQLVGDRLEVMNHYGPTEAAIGCIAQFLDFEHFADYLKHPTIGRPIANTRVFILDRYLQLVPRGTVGEIYVSGKGLAVGYLNRPDLTAERFVSAPAHSIQRQPTPHAPCPMRLYRTGDLGRWRPNGTIEFLGRTDSQVKIRGYRIELEEIQARLTNHEDVREAVVTVFEHPAGERYLCAYVVGDQPAVLAGLREYLSKTVPDYMIPSYFVPLDQIPLTPNRKIDWRALPRPDITARDKGDTTYTAPRDRVESVLAQLWAEALAVERIGIDENFFHIGGNSLKAIMVNSKIYRELGVKVALADIFKAPTISGIASHIREMKGNVGRFRSPSIDPVEKKEYYTLSSVQARLYFLQQLDDTGTGYNMPRAAILEGSLDRKRFEKEFRSLIERHESFRTSFMMAADQPVQRIHLGQDIEFAIEYYEHEPAIEKFIRPFDLSCAPLLRVGLIRIDANKHLLVLDTHHIVADGISMNLFMSEFMTLYGGKPLPALRLQYKDFAAWQDRVRDEESMLTQEKYWLKRFFGEIPALDLPTDFARPAVQSFAGTNMSFEIDRQETAALKRLALDQGVTLYMVLLAAFNILLARVTGQEDIIIGTPSAGRNHAGLEQIVGMFVNTLGLRNFLHDKKTVKDFLLEVRAGTLEAFENQDYQFEELVGKVGVERDTGRNPIFDVMFALQNMDAQEISIPGLILTPYALENRIAKFDLTLMGIERREGLFFELEYASRLFKPGSIERFVNYFRRIISAIIDDPGKEIAEIALMSTAEIKQVIYDFNDTGSRYPADCPIPALFAQQVERVPDRISVIGMAHGAWGNVGAQDPVPLRSSSQVFLSYRELNEKSNRLANALVEKGACSDTIVALRVERSIEMIAAILGILKSGAAYLPIELGFPQERIDYMLKDSGAEILVTSVGAGLAPARDMDIIPISEIFFKGGQPQGLPLQNRHLPPPPATCLAYVIYTSGTTGKPKGVLTMHYNVTRVVKNTNYIDIGRHDRVLQLSNYAFDGSVFDIYGALLNGATLVLVDRDQLLAVDRLAALIKQEQVTLFFVTTALFNTLVDLQLDCLTDVRKVLFGGERVSVQHCRRALASLGKGRVIHMYGPTETTVYASFYDIDGIEEGAATVPIGAPIANTTIYILDKHMQPAPLGIGGEVFIGGMGTARGYLNNPDLTAERFTYMSYRTNESNIPGKLYKTGDLGRWLPDGNIEFLGRIDYQVKIRGFRIELGEIESQLMQHEAVKEAVVVDRADESGDKYLCAYLVEKAIRQDVETQHLASQGTEAEGVGAAPRGRPQGRGESMYSPPAVSDLREFLSQSLPDYMIPTHFVPIDKMPLNANGKVDVKSLPEPEVTSKEEYVAPRNEIEETLVNIWSEVLGIKKDVIGITSDFFELGGHSLKLITMISKIHHEFNVKVELVDIFNMPTIEGISALVSAIRWAEKGIQDTDIRQEDAEEVVL